MTGTPESLTPADREEIRGFGFHHGSAYFGPPNKPLYHYTSGANLIKIIQSGKLWATQIGCLNDASEVQFVANLLKERIDSAISLGTYKQSEEIFRHFSAELKHPRPEGVGWFVTSFTEEKDDLSQWRAYSEGEGGFALEFDPQKLANAASQHRTIIGRVEYDEKRYSVLLDDMLRWTDELCRRALSRGVTAAAWLTDVAPVWSQSISIFAAIIKHAKFSAEREWRLIHFFDPTDYQQMEFLQRRSLISRHIPLAYGREFGRMDSNPHLPLTGVVIGPCRFPNASKLAVGDLLVSKGYVIDAEVKIHQSEIPYRHV